MPTEIDARLRIKMFVGTLHAPLGPVTYPSHYSFFIPLIYMRCQRISVHLDHVIFNVLQDRRRIGAAGLFFH